MNNLSTDVKSTAEIIKERLGGKIAEFLPDEVFDGILEAAIRDLLRVPEKRYSTDPQPCSKLQTMISDEIKAQVSVKIKECVSGPEWQTKFNTISNSYFSEKIEEVIKKNAAQILAETLSNGIGSQLQFMIDQLRRDGIHK
jgi:hypothetical protein